MDDTRRELSAFFDSRYPRHDRRISQAVELPGGWVLAESFERVRDNRGGAYTRYYATQVHMEVLRGERRANTTNHRERDFRTSPEARQTIARWYNQLRRAATEDGEHL